MVNRDTYWLGRNIVVGSILITLPATGHENKDGQQHNAGMDLQQLLETLPEACSKGKVIQEFF